jgi:hypothetical protein
MIRPVNLRPFRVLLKCGVAVAQETEPRVGIPHDTSGETVLLYEQMTGRAANAVMIIFRKRCGDMRVAIRTMKNARVVGRLLKRLVCAPDMAVSTFLYQRMQPGLPQIPVHEERLMAGVTRYAGCIRISHTDELVVVLPDDLRK